MRAKALTLAAVVALAVLAPRAEIALGAQSAPSARRSTPPARKSAPFGLQPGVQGERNPTDLKTILYYGADALGMLRGAREMDWILTMEFWGTGTMNVGGQPCRLANYRASVRWAPASASIQGVGGFAGAAAGPVWSKRLAVPAMRLDFNCAGPGGKPGARQIQVVAGKFAWNEASPGVNATPAPAALTDRLLQLWTLIPESVIKAAVEAGAKTTATVEGGSPVLAFPLPAPLESATMKATLNPKVFRIDTNPSGQKFQYSHLLDRTEVRMGNSVIETTYSDYGDWNEDDLKSMILLPRRIVQKKDGMTVVDLTITKTYTYNPYVIMPVPDSVETASAQQSTAPR